MNFCRRLTVFSHWDPDGIIDDYVLYYLKELKKYSDIIFVSDGVLSFEEIKKITPYVNKSICIKHGEYDFGSYKIGFENCTETLCDYDELLFVNDSCYGPLISLDDLFDRFSYEKCDFWGLTDYCEIGIQHIQSYFICFKKQVFESLVFKNFIFSIGKESAKKDIIKKYEIGLTTLLVGSGFSYSSLVDLGKANKVFTSESFSLTKMFKFPFVKRAIFTKNPNGDAFIYENFKDSLISIGSNYPYILIEGNLERVCPGFKNNLFHPKLIKKNIIHRKILRLREMSGKYFTFLEIRFLGVKLLKFPLRFLINRWRHSRE